MTKKNAPVSEINAEYRRRLTSRFSLKQQSKLSKEGREQQKQMATGATVRAGYDVRKIASSMGIQQYVNNYEFN